MKETKAVCACISICVHVSLVARQREIHKGTGLRIHLLFRNAQIKIMFHRVD